MRGSCTTLSKFDFDESFYSFYEMKYIPIVTIPMIHRPTTQRNAIISSALLPP